MSGSDLSTRAPARPAGGELAIPLALVLPIILAGLTGVFVYATDTYAFPVPAFYEVSAQVIPVLVIAFALERRATEFLSDPQVKLYRAQLFVFLLGGELFAVLGASGALRADDNAERFEQGYVTGSDFWTNVLAGGTAAGLVGGFVMIAVLALSGPGWLRLSLGRRAATDAELQRLRERVKELERDRQQE